jgi:hypothetical protein
MFWRDDTAAKAFITYIMMVSVSGVMMYTYAKYAFLYFAIVQIIGLFVVYLLVRR